MSWEKWLLTHEVKLNSYLWWIESKNLPQVEQIANLTCNLVWEGDWVWHRLSVVPFWRPVQFCDPRLPKEGVYQQVDPHDGQRAADHDDDAPVIRTTLGQHLFRLPSLLHCSSTLSHSRVLSSAWSIPKYWESRVMIHWKRIDSLLIKRINSSPRINSFAWKLQENIDLEFFTVRIDPALVVSCVIKMPRRAGASGDPCTLIHFISVHDIWLLQIQDTLQMLRGCRAAKAKLGFPLI